MATASSTDRDVPRPAPLAGVAAMIDDAASRSGLAQQTDVAIVVVPQARAREIARRVATHLDEASAALLTSEGARRLIDTARAELNEPSVAWLLVCARPLAYDERARLVALATCAASLRMSAPAWGLSARVWSAVPVMVGALGDALAREAGSWFAGAEVVCAVALQGDGLREPVASRAVGRPAEHPVLMRWLGEDEPLDVGPREAIEQAFAEIPAALRPEDGARVVVFDPSPQSLALLVALEGAGYRVQRVDDPTLITQPGAELAVLSLDAPASWPSMRAGPRAGGDESPALLVVSRCGHDDVRLAAARMGAIFLRLPARPLEIARVAIEVTITHRRVVDARRRAEELRVAQAELVRSERMATLGWLAASVGHDLRTPLAAIRSNSDLALRAIERIEREAGLPAPALRTVKTLADLERTNLQAVERLADIVQALKAVARPDDDVPGARDVSLSDVVTHVLALCAHELRHVSIESAVPSGLPHVGVAHAELMQVVMNLVVNAAHALGAGGGRVEVIASLCVAPGSVDLVVRDNGPGIDPAIMPKLFRAGVTTRAAHGGTGLGLSIVKRIVDRHGGQIHVTSEPGQGASFRVTLPVAVRTAGG